MKAVLNVFDNFSKAMNNLPLLKPSESIFECVKKIPVVFPSTSLPVPLYENKLLKKGQIILLENPSHIVTEDIYRLLFSLLPFDEAITQSIELGKKRTLEFINTHPSFKTKPNQNTITH